jgi:MerR family transcriptional regulator, light-induced transcriptional regulator
MGAIELQRRPLYSIGTVARLTGVKPDTLRVWERRYQLGASHKTPSGRRLFTQADLEHLQLVAALVASGTRIGDIASSGRRTLEILLRSRGKGPQRDIPVRKPRILFVGDALCDWLDEHQGCLVHVDALLARCTPSQLDISLVDAVGGIDGAVVECGAISVSTSAVLSVLATALDTSNILVLYRFSNARLLDELSQQGYTTASYPPDPAFLACHLTLSVAVKEASLGMETLGQLVQGKSRLFDEREVFEARGMRSALDCECPRHIADLVRALVTFEEYSAGCSVENWQEASVHACIYAYTMQARWLMEKSLMLVLEAHTEESGA